MFLKSRKKGKNKETRKQIRLLRGLLVFIFVFPPPPPPRSLLSCEAPSQRHSQLGRPREPGMWCKSFSSHGHLCSEPRSCSGQGVLGTPHRPRELLRIVNPREGPTNGLARKRRMNEGSAVIGVLSYLMYCCNLVSKLKVATAGEAGPLLGQIDGGSCTYGRALPPLPESQVWRSFWKNSF